METFQLLLKVDYGSVDLAPKTDVDDFAIAIEADLSSFNSEVWDGFGPDQPFQMVQVFLHG